MFSVPGALDCWYLTGPTASGKSEVAIELARLLDAEIISLDSMAVYRGMDIGTAKPSAELRAQVPHHLLDVVDPNQRFSVSDYLRLADQALREIRGRGREVLFVGGTPLYLKSLLRGMFEGPEGDDDLRASLLAEAAEVGYEALHQRLQLVDPLSAAKLHPHDVRRIVRALEVYRLTGQPISHLQLQFDQARPSSACKVFMLNWPRPHLHERIAVRVERMFASGLVEEVRRLLETYGPLSSTARQAVGYREVLRHLEQGVSLAQTIVDTQTGTRRFAKRQWTWFRSLSECRWIAMDEGMTPRACAEQICGAGWSGAGTPAEPSCGERT